MSDFNPLEDPSEEPTGEHDVRIGVPDVDEAPGDHVVDSSPSADEVAAEDFTPEPNEPEGTGTRIGEPDVRE